MRTGWSIEEVLDQALKNTPLKYKVFDRQIIIIKNTDLNFMTGNMSSNEPVKKRTVTGKVTDEFGNPILGVTIVVKEPTSELLPILMETIPSMCRLMLQRFSSHLSG